MKQFNLFPLARGIVTIIHRQYIIHTLRQRSSTYTLKNKNKKKHTNNGQGDLKLILNSTQTVEFKNNTFRLQKKKKYIKVVKEIRLNKFT